MKKQHDCSEIIQQVELMLDGELNQKEEQNVMCELQRCMECLNDYNLQKRFKEFLSERVSKKTISMACMDRIKQQLNQLD